MMEMIIDPCGWVRDSQHIEKGCLLYLLVRIEIRLQARKDPLFQGHEKLGIVESRVKDYLCVQDKPCFGWGIVMKVGSYAEGEDLRDSPQPASKCDEPGPFQESHALTCMDFSLARAITSSKSRVSNF